MNSCSSLGALAYANFVRSHLSVMLAADAKQFETNNDDAKIGTIGTARASMGMG